MKDLKGRAYALKAIIRDGSVLEADDGFDCIPAGAKRIVASDEDGLYVRCSVGRHHLDGQLDPTRTHYVGFYPVAADNKALPFGNPIPDFGWDKIAKATEASSKDKTNF